MSALNTSTMSAASISRKNVPDYRLKGSALAEVLADKSIRDEKLDFFTREKEKAAQQLDFIAAQAYLDAINHIHSEMEAVLDENLAREFEEEKSKLERAYEESLKEISIAWKLRDEGLVAQTNQSVASRKKAQDEEREALESEHKKALEAIASVRPSGQLLELESRMKKLAAAEQYLEAAVAKAEFETERAKSNRVAIEKATVAFNNALQKLNVKHAEQIELLEKQNESVTYMHQKEREKAFEKAEQCFHRDLLALQDTYNIKLRRVHTPKIKGTPGAAPAGINGSASPRSPTAGSQQQQQQQQRKTPGAKSTPGAKPTSGPATSRTPGAGANKTPSAAAGKRPASAGVSPKENTTKNK